MKLRQYEIECWRRLVDLLVKTGAVTDQDCRARVGAPPTTPGTELFAAIRAWGDAHADLRSADEGKDR